MGDTNTNNSANNVDAVTALTNAATIRKLLRLPNEDGKTNFEIIQVRSISELSNGHNCEVTIRVDLAFGHEGLPVPENERYSVRTETVRRIDLKDVAKLAGLELNDKQQYIGAVTDVAAVAALLKANLTEDDITVSPIKDVMWVRAKPDSVGFIGMLTFAEGGEVAPVEKLPTAINATLSASEVVIGEKVTATIEVLPADAANKAITVVSSDPTIATVNVDGTEITGVKEGNVTITYTSTAAPTVKAEKPLLVKPQPVVKPTGIQVTNIPTEMVEGDVVNDIVVAVTPANATDKTFTATTDDEFILRVSEDGSSLTAVGFGTGNVTYVANGDTSVKNPPPKPTSFMIDGAPEALAFNGSAEMYIQLMPLNAVQEWEIVSSDPAIIEATPVENRCILKGVATGTATITITAVADPELIWTKEITVGEDPNKDASYQTKVTFKNEFGQNPDQFHAGYVNAGDTVNLIIRPQGLVSAQSINLSMESQDVEIEFDKEHVMAPGVDLIVPMTVKASVTDAPVSVYIKVGERIVGMSMGFYVKDPTVIPTTAVINNLPPQIPAGNEIGARTELNVAVNEYIVRNAVWSTNQPEYVTVEPWTVIDPLSVRVVIGAGTPVGSEVILACVVDGLTATSSAITIIETAPDLESIVFETPETIQENGGVVPGVTLTVTPVPENANVGEVTYEVIEVSENVIAQIENGNRLTATGVVQGSTIKVKATVNGTAITAEKVFTVSGEM